ncbi:hypothetical protein LPTSP3_g00600 [Leptospira kobayashii]|uniref:DoxX family protein n=1 Tax=Leptospira kobayashii TaxID=1917830 RepID=A0ABN6KB48_9LEPT|nr:hypothetical protein [Leptospira kobayashii]BDA77130.1 hypothetical protein LPTSP3_g00600 [Leptospira kobayashii]
MNKAAIVVRYILGTIFFVFGLNGFFQFLPAPPMPEAAGTFIGGIISSGYLFPLLKGTEVLAGAALLANFYARLALVILAPITINIFLFHAFLAPEGLPIAVIVLAGNIFLAYFHRDAFASVLVARPRPKN